MKMMGTLGTHIVLLGIGAQLVHGVTIGPNGTLNVPGIPGTTINTPPGSTVSNITITHGSNGSSGSGPGSGSVGAGSGSASAMNYHRLKPMTSFVAMLFSIQQAKVSLVIIAFFDTTRVLEKVVKLTAG